MIIPAIDVLEGGVVRLRQGDFEDRIGYVTDPVELVREYARYQPRRLHIVDLSGARRSEDRQVGLIEKMIRAASCPVQVGGGIRSLEDVQKLMDAGATAAVVGSVAIQEPEVVIEWARQVGAETIVPAMDVRPVDGKYVPVTHGWVSDAAATLESLLAQYSEAGFSQILTTDISRDGMLQGPNSELYIELHDQFPSLSFQASGGVGKIEDVRNLDVPGIAGVIVGRALLDGRISLEEIS